MSVTAELNEVITKILMDKTLSVEALEAVKAITEESKKLTAKLESLDRDYVSKCNALNQKVEENTDLRGQLIKLTEREKAVEKRELAITELEKKAAVQEAIASTFNICFDKVFRNISVHRNVTGNIPVAVEGMAPNQYNSCGSPGTVQKGSVDTFETQTPG